MANLSPGRALSIAVLQTRNAELSGFEDLYLLTWQNTYADIRASVSDEETVWNLLRDVYEEVWKRKENMPEAGVIRSWIRVLIKDVSKRIPGNAIEEFPAGTEEIPQPEKSRYEKAATVLIRVEDQLGFVNGIEKEERDKARRKEEKQGKNVPAAVLKVLLSAAVTVLAAASLFFVVRMVNKSRQEIRKSRLEEFENSSAENKIVFNTTTAAPTPQFGWNETEKGKKYLDTNGSFITENWLEKDGHLYYFDESGIAITGKKTIEKQQCTFNGDGELTKIQRTYDVETKNTILSEQMKQFGKEAEIAGIVKDSVLQDGDWIYYLSLQDSPDGLPELMRFKKDVGQEEIIADSAEGYLLLEKAVWYCRKNELQSFDKNESAAAVGTSEYIISEKNKKYYLMDSSNNPVKTTGGTITVSGRIYRVQDDGLIKYVKSGTQTIGSRTFHLNTAAVDNRIYLSGGTVYLEQGEGIDSICVTGNQLYYSAIIRKDASRPESQIWKINTDTGERKEVTGIFPGRIMNLYYYSDKASFYMEYYPGSLNDIFGKIAVLSSDGKFSVLNDGREKGTDGNSVLEMIWETGDRVFCYRHLCSGKISSDGSLQVLSTTTLNLSDAGRSDIETSGPETAETDPYENTDAAETGTAETKSTKTAGTKAAETETVKTETAKAESSGAAETENTQKEETEKESTERAGMATVAPVPSAQEQP